MSGFELLAVITEEHNSFFVDSCMKENEWQVRLLVDSKYQLWGKLGVIAMPTVVVCGKDDVVFWVKAGSSDFKISLESPTARVLFWVKAGSSDFKSSLESLTVRVTPPSAVVTVGVTVSV